MSDDLVKRALEPFRGWANGAIAEIEALTAERDAERARADRAETERDAERVANGHEKRLRLEMVAHVESAEADVASYKVAASECELECKALRARAAEADERCAMWAGRAIASKAVLATVQADALDISSAASFLLMVENTDDIADAAHCFKVPQTKLRAVLRALAQQEGAKG